MADIINIRMCFVLLLCVVVSRGFDGLAEEPKCFSKFDYDYKLMHLVVNLERQLNDMTTATERLKAEVKELDKIYTGIFYCVCVDTVHGSAPVFEWKSFCF